MVSLVGAVWVGVLVRVWVFVVAGMDPLHLKSTGLSMSIMCELFEA